MAGGIDLENRVINWTIRRRLQSAKSSTTATTRNSSPVACRLSWSVSTSTQKRAASTAGRRRRFSRTMTLAMLPDVSHVQGTGGHRSS